MKKIFTLLIILFFFGCDMFDAVDNRVTNEKVYVALQGKDQVGIVDIDSGDIQFININYDIASCSSIESKTDCENLAGCEWMNMGGMSHCMNSDNDCIDLSESECGDDNHCEWMNMGSISSHCMEKGSMMDMGRHTPHFIAIDKINRYWFVTTINSGYVGRYNLDTDEFIDNIKVGDSPALMAVDDENKKIYVSRMMPMAGMMTGAISTVIQEINYTSNVMVLGSEFIIDSPAPHGIDINQERDEVFVASNTADFIYKLDIKNNDISIASMDSLVNIFPNTETKRLKPIQCLFLEDSLLVITCSGGYSYNSFSGLNDTIYGQVQLWDTKSMSIIDTLQFDWNSSPWHLVASNIDREFYVTLAGDNLYKGSAGVACINYENKTLSLKWEKKIDAYEILHGIDVSNNHDNIYVSGRGDGNLHIINKNNGSLRKSISLGIGALAGGIKAISLE